MMRRVATTYPLQELLLPVLGWSYYRPLNVIPYRMFYDLTGGYPIPIIHALNIAAHLLNGWLVLWLARRLFPEKRWLPLIAMPVYLAYPFSYHAVDWAAALGHVLVATGTLIVCVAGLRWWDVAAPPPDPLPTSGEGGIIANPGGTGKQENQARWKWWGDLVLVSMGAAIAAFSHETGILSFPLPLLVIFFGPLEGRLSALRSEWKRLVILFGPVLAINLLYQGIRLSAPHQVETLLSAPDQIGVALIYFVQGLIYPVGMLGGMISRMGIAELSAAGILDLVSVILVGLLIVFSKERRVWLAVLWFVVAILPAALFLSLGLVLSGPRLLITASVGAALLGAYGVEWLAEKNHLWRLLAVLLVVPGGWFIFTRLSLHDRIAPLYEEGIAAVQDNQTSLVVNMPQWIAPRKKVFAVGSEGINYTDLYSWADLVEGNTGKNYRTSAATWEAIYPELEKYWSPAVRSDYLDTESIQSALPEMDAVLHVVEVNERWEAVLYRPQPDPDQTLTTYRFENGVTVAQVQADHRQSESAVSLILIWGVEEPVEEVMFIHLTCGEEIVDQYDGPPLGGMLPFLIWQPGDHWQEEHVFSTGGIVDTDCLSFRVGLYHPVTGVRVPPDDGKDFITLPVADS